MSESQATPPPAAPARGPATLLLALNAVLLVGVLAVVVLMFLGQKHAPAAAAGGESAKSEGEGKGEGKEGEGKGGPHAAPGAGPTVRLADFVVHLRNPESDRYVRLSFELEVGNDKDKEVLGTRQAQIRDAFISYLSDRTVEELRGSNGLAMAKQALYKQANDLAPDGHIRSIYVTDFVIQ
jgi:flagellar FliL protein